MRGGKERKGSVAGGPAAKTPHSPSMGPGMIPGQGARSHMLQLRVRMRN